MRRPPTFLRSRHRARGRRLVRIGAGVLGGLVVLGVAARFFDSDERPGVGAAGLVAFTGSARAIGLPTKPDDAVRDMVAGDIRAALNQWYLDGFADPARFGDASFDAVGERFVGDASVGFVEDKEALTIGAIAPRVTTVRVDEALANLTIYFENELATWSTAAVEFDAVAELDDRATEVVIAQRVTLVLEQRPDSGWVVTNYYDAFQRQRSRPLGAEPQPRGDG